MSKRALTQILLLSPGCWSSSSFCVLLRDWYEGADSVALRTAWRDEGLIQHGLEHVAVWRPWQELIFFAAPHMACQRCSTRNHDMIQLSAHWPFLFLYVDLFFLLSWLKLRNSVFVLPGLQKLQLVFEWDAAVATYFKYVTSSYMFPHRLDVCSLQPAMTSAADRDMVDVSLECTYYCCLSKTITLTKPCRTSEDIQTVALTSKWHGSHLQRRIIVQVWAQLCFLTVWTGARRAWWQADGLLVISAPPNLPMHTTRYRTCLWDCSFHFICPEW